MMQLPLIIQLISCCFLFLINMGSVDASDVCREKLLNHRIPFSQESFNEVHYLRLSNFSTTPFAANPPALCKKGTEKWHFFAYGGMNPKTHNQERHKQSEIMAQNASKLPYIDSSHAFHPADIDSAFQSEHSALLNNPRCFAFLSKVYFLHQLLVVDASISEGDVVLYLDSDMEITNQRGLHLLACLVKNSERGKVFLLSMHIYINI
jgi:hypothetical protein